MPRRSGDANCHSYFVCFGLYLRSNKEADIIRLSDTEPQFPWFASFHYTESHASIGYEGHNGAHISTISIHISLDGEAKPFRLIHMDVFE